MQRKINRFGEVEYTKDEALVTMPFMRLNTEDEEIIEENYRQKIKEMDYSSSFFYANSITSIRDRLQLSFDLEGAIDFHHIHKVRFRDMMDYFYSMIEIARTDVNVLWERNNFVIDTTEKKIKALLFEFEGFPVYKKDKSVEGLKELILLALTKNIAILGKPKRADFIEQTNEVIQFAEDIIRSKDVDEIYKIVESYDNHFQFEDSKKQAEKEEKRKNSKINRILYKFKKEPKNEKEQDLREDVIKSTLSADSGSKVKEKSNVGIIERMTTPKGMIITICSLIIGIGIFFMLDIDSQASSDKTEQAMKEKIKQKDKVLEAYRLYVSNDEDKKKQAYAKLEKVGYSNLNEGDQAVLIKWLLEQEKYTKAITTDKDSAYFVGDILVSKEGGLEELEKLENQIDNNKVIKFDIARIKNEYQSMIENGNIRYNDERAKKIVESYVMTNQIEELEAFLEKKKDDESSYENLEKYYNSLVDRYKEKLEIKEELKELNKERESLEDKIKKEKKKDKKKKHEKSLDKVKKQIEEKNNRTKSIDEAIKEQ